ELVDRLPGDRRDGLHQEDRAVVLADHTEHQESSALFRAGPVGLLVDVEVGVHQEPGDGTRLRYRIQLDRDDAGRLDWCDDGGIRAVVDDLPLQRVDVDGQRIERVGV